VRGSQWRAAEETAPPPLILSEAARRSRLPPTSAGRRLEGHGPACLKAYGASTVLDNNVGIAEMASVVEVSEPIGTAVSRST